MPTLPLPSPTTDNAQKLKRRPPFTTLAQRLMKTTFSNMPGSPESLPGPLEKDRLLLAMERGLELQTTLAGGFGKGFDAAVIGATVAVEHHGGDAGGLGLGGEGSGERLGAVHVALRAALLHLGVEGRKEHEGRAGVVVDGLRIDVLAGELDAEARASGGAGHLLADAPFALLEELGLVNSFHGLGSGYGAVLPSGRRTRSACCPPMRTPLPLYGSGG